MSLSSAHRDIIVKELSAADPVLKRVFEEVGDLDFQTLYRPTYVALIGAIVGQKIAYTQARKIRGNLFQKLGTNFQRLELEKLSDREWQELKLPEPAIARVKAINTYLRRINGDNYASDFPYGFQTKRLRELQREVEGVGEWTVQTTQLVAMLNLDVFPYSDLFLQNRIRKLYQLSTRPDIKQVEKMSNQWSPYRGVVAWYLWRWF